MDIWTSIGAAAFLLLSLLFFAAIIFIPAGTIYWPDAWIFLLAQLGLMAIIGSWLSKNNPELLKERTDLRGRGTKRWDRIVQVLFIILIVVFFYVAAQDALYHKWSPVPPALKALGLAGLAVIMAGVFWVMRTNTFLSRTVRLQKERGQTVVTTGPYKYVRHPMYAFFALYLPCIALILGSYYAILLTIPFDIVIMVRAVLEENMLKKGLEGYKEYMEKTRYRLIPKVW